jgi:hypothetical protein
MTSGFYQIADHDLCDLGRSELALGYLGAGTKWFCGSAKLFEENDSD